MNPFVKILLSFLGVLVVLVTVALVFMPSLRAGWVARHIIESASSVEVTEYRRTIDEKPLEPLTTRSLSRAEISRVADSFGRFDLPDPGNACMFSPHHVIRCQSPDGSTHQIAVCFMCGHIAIDTNAPLAVGGYVDRIAEGLKA